MKKNLTYSDKLKDPRWQKKRLQVFQRDKFTCTQCKDTETTLHVHHHEYYGNPWEAEISQLTTLCADCHDITEALKKQGNSAKFFFKYSVGDIKVMIVALLMPDTDEPVSSVFINSSDRWVEISHKISYRTAAKMIELMNPLIK